MKKTGSMTAMAERLLNCTVEQDSLEDTEGRMRQLWEGLRGRTGRLGVTVAQAIVLALGRKALDGDKTAAEYLQRLAEQQEQKKTMRSENDSPVVIRVRVDGSDGEVISDWDEEANPK